MVPGSGFNLCGLSRHAYTRGNPTSRTDPTGHDDFGGGDFGDGGIDAAGLDFKNPVTNGDTLVAMSDGQSSDRLRELRHERRHPGRHVGRPVERAAGAADGAAGIGAASAGMVIVGGIAFLGGAALVVGGSRSGPPRSAGSSRPPGASSASDARQTGGKGKSGQDIPLPCLLSLRLIGTR